MRIKQSVICTGINNYLINEEAVGFYTPQFGDVAIFEVLEIGKHRSLQCDDRKNHKIFPGDMIMMAFGTRYATSQLHGYLPNEVQDVYHILGQGGVCGIVESFHHKYELRGPTSVRLVGFVCGENNEIINTKYLNVNRVEFNPNRGKQRIILSIGGSMDSGKTTTAGFLCRGLRMAGHKVTFIKLTGTIYTKDVDFVVDCGADTGLDFGYCGYPSTYQLEKEEILDLFETLIATAEKENPDYIVMEIADGICQKETNLILKSEIMNRVASIIYSDSSSTGALSGLELLKGMNLRPFALCGSFTASPLLIEEVRNYTSSPVLTLEDLLAANVEDYFRPCCMKALELELKHSFYHNLSEAV